MPCEFCHSHNTPNECIKIMGPKTEVLHSRSGGDDSFISRTVTAYDPSITEGDQWILMGTKVLASDPFHSFQPMFNFFEKLSLVYGPSISHPALRHAVCAFTCSRLPKHDFIRELEYTQLACNALGRRLQNPAVLDEGD